MKSTQCKPHLSEVYRENTTEEQMDCTKKSKILEEGFNLSIIMHSRPEEVKLILVRLVYLFFNGECLGSSEQEKLLCEISKLFIINDHYIKRIMYKILKFLINKQSQYVFIQSLFNDLTGSCSIIRQDALKMIHYIKEEQLILQFQKYLGQALHDQNTMISDTAMVTYFHLLRHFPNLVIPFSQEILERLNKQYQEKNIHAFNLAYCMKQNSILGFTKTLHQLIQQPKCPRMNMQLIRIIGVISSTDTSDKSQVLLNYVYSQVQLREQPLVFFEALKSLIRISSLSTAQLQPIIKICFEHLQQLEHNIEVFTALRIIHHLVLNNNRNQIIQNDQLWFFESLTSSPHHAISRLAFMILFSFWKKDEIAGNLQWVYKANYHRQSQIYFLEGLHELLTVRLTEGEQIITFINAISKQLDHDEVLFPAMHIFYNVMKFKDQSIEKHAKSLLLLVLNQPWYIISFAVQVLYEVQYNKYYVEVNQHKIYSDFRYYLERYYRTPVEVHSRKMYVEENKVNN